MTEEVKRNYLEISSINDLNEGNKPSEDYSLNLIDGAIKVSTSLGFTSETIPATKN